MIPQDLRLALRLLWRRPAFTAAAVLTLAIGMGVNTVAFGVVNGLLFRGFTTAALPGIGRIATTPEGDDSGYGSLEEYGRFAAATHGAIDLAAEGRLSVAWQHDGTTDTAWLLAISSNYFSMVKAGAIAGQLRVARVPGESPSVVLGERFWRERLASRSLAGLTLRLNNTDVSVAGVVSGSFTGPGGVYSPDVWVPLEDLGAFGLSPALQKRETRWLFLLGRLLEGVTPAAVQGHLDTAVAAMAREWPDTHANRGARFRMFNERNSELRGLTAGAAIGMGIIGLVLLLACFNVANLLLARAVERERDMGIRSALGATPVRLMRLVVTEGLVLAALSGVLALILAWWTRSIVGAFAIPIEQPQHIDLTPDSTVVLFVLALVAVAGVLPGLWPAFAAARVDVARVLGSQGANAVGKPSRLRRSLVAVQVAGSTAFVAVAALFVQSYTSLGTADIGFEPRQLVVAEFEPASNGYSRDRAERFADSLMRQVQALPGAVDAALADRVPFFIGYDRQTPVSPRGTPCDPDTCPKYPAYRVSPGYFQTMKIALVEGRAFQRVGGAEVIVSEAFARKHWPAGGGLGETLRVGAGATAMTVIGITARTHTRGLDHAEPVLFMPLDREQFDERLTLVVRTTTAPASFVRSVVETAHALDQNVALQSVKTMEQRMAVQLWPFRTLSWMFSICGGLAVMLATVGLVGVVIHAVSRRTREFGVRISIGATPRDLVTDVLGSSARLLVPGLVIGLVLAVVLARLTQAIFVGVNVLNPVVYLGVALAQGLVVLVACVGPALRASRLDPLVALRTD